MARVQKYLEEFHDTIRIDYGLSEPLREKRDILVKKIKDHLQEKKLPTCTVLLQGSYAMKTGTVPPSGLDYDIDVGLRFCVDPEESSATMVRGWVLGAVKGHTNDVQDKRPCIRVVYEKGYRVDLVVYSDWDDQLKLGHKTEGWRESDPLALLEFVDDARESFNGTEDSATKTDQFRRVVRYLRRWIDCQGSRSSALAGQSVVTLSCVGAWCRPPDRVTGVS